MKVFNPEPELDLELPAAGVPPQLPPAASLFAVSPPALTTAAAQAAFSPASPFAASCLCSCSSCANFFSCLYYCCLFYLLFPSSCQFIVLLPLLSLLMMPLPCHSLLLLPLLLLPLLLLLPNLVAQCHCLTLFFIVDFFYYLTHLLGRHSPVCMARKRATTISALLATLLP